MDIKGNSLKITQSATGILQLTLDRPEALNALNADLLHNLNSAFLKAKEDTSIRAVLITGAGKAFCAGADINQLNKLNANTGFAFAQYGQKIFRTLEQLGKPSLVAINGYALGGGCELAMAATLRIAVESAKFGQPEIKLGVIPGFGGTQRLARLIGKGRALDLCLSGRIIDGKTAFAWGMISELVAPSLLIERATEILESLCQLSPAALRSTMAVIDHGYDLALEDAFAFEAAHFGLCCATKDKEEGCTAFLEKRKPEFIGE